MPQKLIIFDATLFVNAYETQLFRTGLYRVSEQLLKQLLLAGKYDMATDGTKITKIDILLKQSKLEALKEEMDKLGITGMTVSQVLGCGAQKGKAEYYRGVAIESNLLPKMKVEIVVCKVPVKAVVDAAVKALYTGHIGDGKIFIYDVEDVVKVRTGETGYDAMQDVE